MFSITIMKKAGDIIPARGYSFDKKGMGPSRRNFVIPNELDSTLVMKEINGIASPIELN